MKPSYLRPLLIAGLSLCLFALSPVTLHAQATKIFVASYGNDANDGSRGSPKRNFQAAHDAVAARGQIVVLDTAGYGALSITKSVAVTVPPGVNGFVTVSGSASNGITIHAATSDIISLRGLIIEGVGGGSSGITGDSFATLNVESCTVRNFGFAFYLIPNSSAQVNVRDTVVRNVDNGFTLETLSSGVLAEAILTGCTLDGISNSAVYAYAAGNGTAACHVSVSRCVLSRFTNALETGGSNEAQTVLDNSTVISGSYCFFKQNNLGIAYSRGNNTGAFVTNTINGSNSITTLGGF